MQINPDFEEITHFSAICMSMFQSYQFMQINPDQLVDMH